MARAFKRLAREASKTRHSGRVLNWANRLHKLEVCLFEVNARLVSLLQRMPEGELTEADKDFLTAAEEFRSHLKTVLESSNGS